MRPINRVLVTGGAGYVGAVLVPKLLDAGYEVKVLDLFIYGGRALDTVKENSHLELVKGDIRDRSLLEKIMPVRSTASWTTSMKTKIVGDLER